MKKVICLILSVITLIGIIPMGIYAEERPFHDVPADDIEAAAQREDEELGEDIAEAPSTVTEKGMQFKIDNLQDVKSIRYAYGEYDTEKDIKYGADSVSHSAKTLRTRGDSCILQFLKPGLVSIVVTYNDGSRDFYKYDVIKSTPTVTRDGGNSITFSNLSDLKVLRYVKGEFENSYDIKRANGSVAISGKTLDSDTYTATLDRETYTFCVQYNDESYNYYVTGVCGDNLTWVYDMQSATLTVSGEGEMDENCCEIWSSCSNVTEKLNVSEGITTIGGAAFSNFEKLVRISLPTTLEKIGVGAFAQSSLLDNITLPSSLRQIESFAFYECDSLESIVIPDSVQELGATVFQNCDNLESVVIGNGIKTIKMRSFYKCLNLKNVTFGNNIITIEYQAFYHCKSLNDIGGLPDSIEEIDAYVFYDTGYYNNKDNWENNVLYLDNHLIAAGSNLTCIIKDGTKTIASYAFENSRADVIYIPESVSYIAYGGLVTGNTQFGIWPDTIFMVVKGSYAEQYLKSFKCSYDYFDPSDIYG